MEFVYQSNYCVWLCLCLLLSGCNSASEEKNQNEAEQPPAQEKETTSAPQSGATQDVSSKESETNPATNPPESSNTDRAGSKQPASNSALPNTPGRNSSSARNPSTEESTAGYSLATSLRKRAANYAKNGDSKSAYQTTLVAWETMRKEKPNKKSQQLSTELLQDMEKYGERLQSPMIQNVLQKPVRYE